MCQWPTPLTKLFKRTLKEHLSVLLQYMLGHVFSQQMMPYTQQQTLLKTLRHFGCFTGNESLENLPSTPDTLFTNFGVWSHAEATHMYVVCDDHHIVKLADLHNNGELADRVCNARLLDGSTCQKTFLRSTHSATGRVYHEPRKPLPWVGLSSQVELLFSREWFVKQLSESRDMPALRGDARGDLRDGERFLAAREYLDKNGKEFAVQVVIFIDWCVFYQNPWSFVYYAVTFAFCCGA